MSDGKQRPCEVCGGRGYLFPHTAGHWICVEACGLCEKFPYDDDAAATLGEELLQIDPSYAVTRAFNADIDDVASDIDAGDYGPVRFVVTKLDISSQSFRLIDEDEAMELAYKLGIMKLPPAKEPSRKCCPHCGATDLVVSLPAAFNWDGRDEDLHREDLSACEFAIEDDALCVCNDCENIFRVRDMKETK